MNRTIYSDHLGNEIRISSIREWSGKAKFNGMSAKYVLQGIEFYITSKKNYTISEGEYLIGNQFTESNVMIQSEVDVMGLCIDISEEVVIQMCHKLKTDVSFLNYLLKQQLIVNKYNRRNSLLGKQLDHLAWIIFKNEEHNFDISLFERLSQALIEDQILIFQTYGRLKFKKQFTKKEVFDQLMKAKDFMESNWNKGINLETIAKEIGMSKFHFARIYKDVFGTSPYQFLISLKMQNALNLLKKEKSVQEVADSIGYPDVSSFSKAFSKFYGLPPSLHQKIA